MISYLAALLAAVTNATSNALPVRHRCGVFGEPVRSGPVLALLVLPGVALIAGAALIRPPRLQALQVAGTSSAAPGRAQGRAPERAAGRR